MNVRVRVFVVMGVLGIVGLPAYGQTFTGVGDLPGGDEESFAFAVSSDGNVVVGVSSSANGDEAFRWEGGVISGLGDLAGGDFVSYGYGASSDGSVVVGASDSNNSAGVSAREAYRWSSGVMSGLGDLEDTEFNSQAFGVSADGNVVVGFGTSAPGQKEAFRWSAGTMTGLGDLTGGAFESQAVACSSDGSVIVGVSKSTNGTEAFRWVAGVMSGLGDLPGGSVYSEALDVTPDGSVVVGRSKVALDAFEAFRWVGGVMSGLGDLGGTAIQTEAFAVSADGETVVGQATTGSGFEAFVWTPNDGMLKLSDVIEKHGIDLTGWSLSRATDISGDGKTIVGYGTDPNGNAQGWIFAIPSESPLVRYSLTVTDGTGSGNYDPNEVVAVTATVPAGKRFDKWTGDTTNVADPNSASTTVTMLADTSIAASFVDQYTLTVTDGSGSGTYDANAVVAITANAPPSGKVFDQWVGDTTNVADVNASSTTVTMLANTLLTAAYIDAPSDTSGCCASGVVPAAFLTLSIMSMFAMRPRRRRL